MRYSFIAIIALAFLGANPTTAATVVTDEEGSATAILGLEVPGQELPYNVEFILNFWDADAVYGGPPPVLDVSADDAPLFISAINAVLTAENIEFVADDGTDTLVYAIGTTYIDDPNLALSAVGWLGGARVPRAGLWTDERNGEPIGGLQTQLQSIMWAKLTVVPVPPAIWLFGSALGLLGWVRRRTGS